MAGARVRFLELGWARADARHYSYPPAGRATDGCSTVGCETLGSAVRGYHPDLHAQYQPVYRPLQLLSIYPGCRTRWAGCRFAAPVVEALVRTTRHLTDLCLRRTGYPLRSVLP